VYLAAEPVEPPVTLITDVQPAISAMRADRFTAAYFTELLAEIREGFMSLVPGWTIERSHNLREGFRCRVTADRGPREVAGAYGLLVSSVAPTVVGVTIDEERDCYELLMEGP
jgi:hypothetical protein